jgi:formate-dependent nitrite reductase membrane component NrfD
VKRMRTLRPWTSQKSGSGAGRAKAQEAERGDGRNIDLSVGVLEGEASGQRVPRERAPTEGAAPFEPWPEVPSHATVTGAEPTYYERPVLKEPTWIWSVPAYFYAGGAAGAAAVLGAAAQIVDRKGFHGLIKRCRWIAAAGGGVGTLLLIIDLGRPERFLNMLRVFRPTSPMNLGSWVLSTIAPLATVSAVLADAEGILGLAGDVAGLNGGLAGLPLAGYTAVLISNTAVPLWQETRRSLPFLFIASAMTAASGLLQTMELTDRERAVVRRFAIAGAIGESLAGTALRLEGRRIEQVSKPLHEGVGSVLIHAAEGLNAAYLVATIRSGNSRAGSAVAGALATAGSLAVKFGIFHAGKASARDPRATFQQQRAGHGAAEVARGSSRRP